MQVFLNLSKHFHRNTLGRVILAAFDVMHFLQYKFLWPGILYNVTFNIDRKSLKVTTFEPTLYRISMPVRLLEDLPQTTFNDSIKRMKNWLPQLINCFLFLNSNRKKNFWSLRYCTLKITIQSVKDIIMFIHSYSYWNNGICWPVVLVFRFPELRYLLGM